MTRFDWKVPPRPALTALALGLGASLLGYGIYVLVPAATFTAAGIGNRSMFAGATGVALAIAAAIALVTRLAGPLVRRGLGGALFALLAMLLSLTTARIADHWARAYGNQQAILGAAAVDLASNPAGSTVLLDGFCPYDGPAILFESDWGVSGALWLKFDRPITGNIIAPPMRFERDGIATSIYGYPYFYRYGPSTYVYDPGTRSAAALRNWTDAREYLARRRAPDCPEGYPGHGVPI
jgi:hypothetical protein